MKAKEIGRINLNIHSSDTFTVYVYIYVQFSKYNCKLSY